jgi:hypothetical protein
MKRISYIRVVLASLFASIVLLTVSVQEIHYLFVDHHALNEHCDNHLHPGHAHADCTLCKFDVSSFTDQLSIALSTVPACYSRPVVSLYHGTVFCSVISTFFLRGPPVFAS